MIVCGIDPGVHGGVSFVQDEDRILGAWPMPILVRDVDAMELRGLLMTVGADKVVVELQSVRNAQAGALRIGANYGRLLATVELLGLPCREVTPAVWARKAGIPPKLKPGREKKDGSFAAARRTWGAAFDALGLKRSQDGPVDALLIARYG